MITKHQFHNPTANVSNPHSYSRSQPLTINHTQFPSSRPVKDLDPLMASISGLKGSNAPTHDFTFPCIIGPIRDPIGIFVHFLEEKATNNGSNLPLAKCKSCSQIDQLGLL